MRNKASTDTGAIYSIGMSVFNGAPQKEYVSATCGSPCEYAEIFESAVNAFANEARVAFEISSNKVGDNVKRYESPRAFIIKLMLAIGLLPHDNSFAVIAKLVETLCLNPQIRLNDAIMRFAEAHGSTVDAVTRAIEKSLDAYDEKLIQRVTAFTQSRPMTAKDIICDIAVYVRAKYIDGKCQMNNISDNPYIKNRYTSLNEYSLNTFLFRDVAVERAGNCDEIKLALGNILAAHGFNINLIGFKFILNLTARYLIKSDYDEAAEIQTIADIYGTIPNIVRDSIKACVNYNRRFIKSASAELGYNIDSSKALEIKDVVEIIGALFKINYNYIADSEITDDGRRAVNFVRMTLNHG